MQEEAESLNKWKPVHMLIVTALPEEKLAILHLLEKFEPVRVGKVPIYYVCTLPTDKGECTIAVTLLPRIGNVEGGIHVTRCIDDLDPACVLMVGIAAGIRGQVALGDVIVCDQVFYYEQAKQTPQGVEVRLLSVAADRALLQAAQNCQNSTWCSLIPTEGSESNNTNPPQVWFGPFAVGDKIVADQSCVDELLKLHPKLIGIEMESYGVAAAAASAPGRPRFLAIRGVSDFADARKDDSCRKRASDVAAAFTVGLLRYGPLSPNILRSQSEDVTSGQPASFIAIRHLSMQPIPSQTVIESLPSQLTDKNVVELLIDQTDLYTDGRLSDPLEAVRRQDDLDCHIDDLLKSHPGASVGYFGIAHIPLLFRSGFRLTNKRKMRFFEFDRYTGKWGPLQGQDRYPELIVNGLPTRVDDGRGDVLIRISVSNTVRSEEVAEIVPSPIASIHLRIAPPQRDVLHDASQLYDYGANFRRMLDMVHEFLPNRERTYIFYAGPVSLAVYFGQLIIHTIDRRIVVFNYTTKDSPRYSWGLEITASTDTPDFLVRLGQ